MNINGNNWGLSKMKKALGLFAIICVIIIVNVINSGSSKNYALTHVKDGPLLTCAEDAEHATAAFLIYTYYLENNENARTLSEQQPQHVQNNVAFHLNDLHRNEIYRHPFGSVTADRIDAEFEVFHARHLAACIGQ
jgi:hypothetical protein